MGYRVAGVLLPVAQNPSQAPLPIVDTHELMNELSHGQAHTLRLINELKHTNTHTYTCTHTNIHAHTYHTARELHIHTQTTR